MRWNGEEPFGEHALTLPPRSPCTFIGVSAARNRVSLMGWMPARGDLFNALVAELVNAGVLNTL